MRILFLNGSPRSKSNTRTLLSFIAESVDKDLHQVEIIDVGKMNLRPFLAPDDDAVSPVDEATPILEKMVQSDMIVFGSPVYWWGVTAQLKTIIDRMYEVQGKMKNKKIGVVTVGAAELEDPEYRIIDEQFKCIAEYLNWEVVFSEAVSAFAPGEVLKDQKYLKKFRAIGEKL